MKSMLKRVGSIVLIAVLATALLPMQSTYAENTVNGKILDKAYASALKACYENDKVFNSTISINGNNSIADGILNAGTALTGGTVNTMLNSATAGTHYLPTSYTASDARNCKTLIEDTVSRTGKVSVPSSNASMEDKQKFYEAFGYTCESVGASNKRCTMSSNAAGATAALKNLFGYSVTDTKLTANQQMALYQSYLTGIYGASLSNGNVVCGSEANKLSESDGWYSVKYADGSTDNNKVRKNCKAKVSSNASAKVNGVDAYGYYMSGENGKMSFEQLAKAMSALDVATLTDNQMDAIDEAASNASGYDSSIGANSGAGATSVGSSNTKAVEGEDDPCFGLSGALGWMFCPIVNALGEALSTVYDAWIEPMLATSPGVLQAMQVDGGNGIYTAWGLFRDIANIVFVILLLVVIFSQVTGFGIDNYGIKRMLPRLIIAAVLVNFSFIICQLAVDISNILGSSLKDLFISFGKEVGMASGNDPATIGDFISVILAGLGILGIATAVFAYGSQTNWAFLLSIGVTLLVAVIAVLFGFFLLGVRQAAVVLLVVTSPLAFVLYMLPNTYRYFQQWLRLFLRMLLVYPACGLMIGAGYFSARIILSVDDGLVFNLIGLILLVAPYFLIIPLVRTSMNAINGLGGKIQAIGSGMQRGANSAIRGSETYKNLNTQIRGARAPKRVQDLQKRMNSRTKTTGLRGAINRIPGMSAVNKARNEADMAMVSSQIGSLGQQDIETMKNMQKMDEVAHPGESAREILDRMNAEVTGNTKNDQLQRQAMLTRVADMGGQKEIAKWAREEIENSNFNLDDQQMDTLADFLGKDGKSMAEFKKIAPSMANYLNQRGRVNGQRVSMLDENGQVRGAFHEKYDKDVDIASLDEKGFAFAVAHDGLTAQRIVESGAFGPNASQAARQATREGTRKMADLFTGAAANSNTMAQHVINSYSAGNTNPGNVMGSVTRSDGTAEARRIESLTLAGGLNVVGQSGALSGYMPNTSDDSDGLSGFNATKAYKATSGEVIMEDDNGRKWDATNGRNVSGQSFDIQTNFNSADSTPSSSTGAPTFEDGGGI